MRVGSILIGVVLLCLCLWSAVAPASQGGKASVEQAGPAIANGALEAQELADYLGISVWTFRYSGGRVRCWLEITENGKTTQEPQEGVQDPNKQGAAARQGKIQLWIKPGELQLRTSTEASRGGSVKGYPKDALWWGWKSWSAMSSRPPRPEAPKPGETVTLLTYQVRESPSVAAEPQAPRTVRIDLKAEFPKED